MTAQAVEPLPRVSGRHQNHVLAAARRERAIRLRTQGLTYQQIADDLGYANAGTVYSIVSKAQAKQLTEAIEDHRATSLLRLEEMAKPLWPKAEKGDPKAVMALLGIEDRRLRLLGIDVGARRRGTPAEWPSCQGPATVVVRDEDCRHRGCSKHGRFDTPPQR